MSKDQSIDSKQNLRESQIVTENRSGNIAKALTVNILILIGLVISIFPLYYLTVSTTFTQQQFFLFPPKLTPGPQFIGNYSDLLRNTPFISSFVSTLVYSVGATIGTMIVATLSGYAFSMFAFRGRKPLFSLILVMMSVPFQLIAIALFSLLLDFGLVDTYLGAILPVLVFPIVLIMMKQNFDQISINSILNSARIDGASELRIFYHIVLPIMRPTIAAGLIITFLWRSGELFWPLIVFQSAGHQTIPMFIANQIGYRTSTQWTIIMPAAFILTVPSIFVAIYFQRHFVKGLTAGSTK